MPLFHSPNHESFQLLQPSIKKVYKWFTVIVHLSLQHPYTPTLLLFSFPPKKKHGVFPPRIPNTHPTGTAPSPLSSVLQGGPVLAPPFAAYVPASTGPGAWPTHFPTPTTTQAGGSKNPLYNKATLFPGKKPWHSGRWVGPWHIEFRLVPVESCWCSKVGVGKIWRWLM